MAQEAAQEAQQTEEEAKIAAEIRYIIAAYIFLEGQLILSIYYYYYSETEVKEFGEEEARRRYVIDNKWG
jgi:hypothetical protein